MELQVSIPDKICFDPRENHDPRRILATYDNWIDSFPANCLLLGADTPDCHVVINKCKDCKLVTDIV